jgi:hypothetical protein
VKRSRNADQEGKQEPDGGEGGRCAASVDKK